MKQHSEIKSSYPFPLKAIIVISIMVTVIVITSFGFKNNLTHGNANNAVVNKDSIESVKAFMEVYKVLMSPRCMNCHPAGDVPLQGDDSHLHTMFPRRGNDGKGVYAMKCSNCHQPYNIPGLHTPPGHPDWHLPPANMKMVFQGRTPNQLAKQIVNPKLNGNKTLDRLIQHADDGLVLVAWKPGDGRSVPPLSHEAFKKAWITWIKKGAYAPRSK